MMSSLEKLVNNGSKFESGRVRTKILHLDGQFDLSVGQIVCFVCSALSV